MVSLTAFKQLLFLLPLAYREPQQAQNDAAIEWDYSNPNDWATETPICNGTRQSPIALASFNSFPSFVQPIRFINYKVPLTTPLVLVNDGHTASMDIGTTTNGRRPIITGGYLRARYEAVNVHFHWGNQTTKGSEHTINDVRYDVEMHIVHKNERYATVDEASQRKDGLAVLGIMLQIVDDNVDRFYPGINVILNKLPDIIAYNARTNIDSPLRLEQLLGDVNLSEYYTYEGSLTTPPCSEAVIWTVFPKPLPITSQQISKFWNLLDKNGNPLINNFRPLQNRYGRPVFFRYRSILDLLPVSNKLV